MIPTINSAGRALIQQFEGCKLTAYKCPAGIWTIGVGHTGDVKAGDKITQHQADAILDVDLDKFENYVADLCPKSADHPNHFAALVSFCFNLGQAALSRSTLRKKYNAGDFSGAADEFLKWKMAGGKVLAGLVKRREAERALFLTPAP